tara:strand:- start:96 stop:1019 length:924 start_codon:yes stop_codon:yes gene_type:complete
MNYIINKDIDTDNINEIYKEIQRLRCERNNYNINDIPRPSHIKRSDFDTTAGYKTAKEQHRLLYINTYHSLDNEIKRLQAINTNLCIEIKKKEDDKAIEEGTFYNNEEKEYLAIETAYKAEARKVANMKYHDANKEKLRLKALLNKHKKEQKEKELIKTPLNKHLILSFEIIKPLCLCCRTCNVLQISTLKKHSTSTKHKLFKSIISFIHYKRQTKKIKSIINSINKELCLFKKVVKKMKPNGKIGTMTNKTDIEICKYYNNIVEEIDDNKFIIKEPYINKVEYNSKYKDKLLLLQMRKVNIKKLNH